MEITVRVYVKERNHRSSRAISLNDGELDGMISEYLKDREYVKSDEYLESITIEGVRL